MAICRQIAERIVGIRRGEGRGCAGTAGGLAAFTPVADLARAKDADASHYCMSQLEWCTIVCKRGSILIASTDLL